MRPIIASVLVAFSVVAPASASLRADLRRAAAGLGPRAGLTVVDVRSRRKVFDLRGGTERSIGSTTKLFTAAAALRGLAPPRTAAFVAVPVLPDGTVDGDLFLRGGGDPTFGSAAFVDATYGGDGATAEALAAAVHGAGVRDIRGSVVGDESAFDQLRGPAGPAPDAELEPLTALSYNRSRASDAGAPQADPAIGAAQRFDDALEALGIVVRGVPRTGATPANPGPVGQVQAPPVPALIALMLKPSDDFIAEMLTKGLALQSGVTGSTAAGAAIVQREAAAVGARVRLLDGSGLSAADRASPRQVVRLLAAASVRPELAPLVPAMPRPSEGTLVARKFGAQARKRCRLKTGTLPGTGVSALSGVCRSTRGRRYAVSILSEGTAIAGARKAQDAIVRRLARAG